MNAEKEIPLWQVADRLNRLKVQERDAALHRALALPAQPLKRADNADLMKFAIPTKFPLWDMWKVLLSTIVVVAVVIGVFWLGILWLDGGFANSGIKCTSAPSVQVRSEC